ncbi:hypothetical protein GF322_04560 [Candidatus Dependentiae bacterium]|nr:hypothetical protein [Candidatus Dependentiae bacterium]
MNKDVPISNSSKFKGNALLFYVLDIGDEIDLEKIHKKGLINVKTTPLSPYFKNYHRPLSFSLSANQKNYDQELQENVEGGQATCLMSKIHNFGVISFCYKVSFYDSLEGLKLKLIEISNLLSQKSKKDAKLVYEKILPTIKKPRFYNLDNFYFAVQVDPLSGEVDPHKFKESFGREIASLLRLETESLSSYQLKEILSATTGYSGEDFMIIDTEASFIYDDEYYEVLEFFEFANIQLLELRYFDRILDEKLNYFYMQKHYKIPLSAYIPFLGEKFLHVFILSQIKVDISVITERLEYSIKMAGDTYFTEVYSILSDQLSLKDWRDSINKKLEIINDIYTVYQDRLDIIRDEILTTVIIILIIIEAAIAFWK